MANIKNLRGEVDLLKLNKTCIVTIKGKRCVVVPLEFNNIYVNVDDNTGKANCAKLALNIYERKEVSKYGKTHYCKQGISKKFKEERPEEDVNFVKDTFVGDFEPYEFEAENKAAEVVAPAAEIEEADDDMPF